MPFKKSLTILFLFLSVFASSIQNLFSQAPTSENEQRIKAYLEKFPKSDADDNGIPNYLDDDDDGDFCYGDIGDDHAALWG